MPFVIVDCYGVNPFFYGGMTRKPVRGRTYGGVLPKKAILFEHEREARNDLALILVSNWCPWPLYKWEVKPFPIVLPKRDSHSK